MAHLPLASVLCLLAAQASAATVEIAVADDPQAVVDAHPAGTTYLIEAGLHRFASITPKLGDVYQGETGAIFSGARLLTGFVHDGARWRIGGQTQEGQVHGDMEPGWEEARHPEDLYIDDVPLHHVASLDLVGPGTYWFDYPGDTIWIGDDPAGHRVETAVTRAAFEPGAENVAIRGLIVEKYAIPPQMGAIGDQYPAAGWTVQDCEVRLVHGTGVTLGAHGRALRNRLHHNGQKGIGAGGVGALVEGNEMAFNNYDHVSPGWEAGACKFSNSDGLVVRDNWVHDNDGGGLWTDIDNIRTTYEYNSCLDNGCGIFHEISYQAVIRWNTLIHNGQRSWVYGAGVQISASQDVEAFGNLIEVTEGHGIELIAQNRGSGAYGPWLVRRDQIHDNEITYRTTQGASGSGVDFADPDVQNGAGGNLFDHNRYHASSLTDLHWGWNNAARTWDDFRAQGMEAHGVADTQVVPLGAGVCFIETWNGIGGETLDALVADSRFPGAPDRSRHLTRLEYSGLGDSYGARVRALVHPPLTGDYVFALSGDDHCELWLGSDARARSRRQIASVPGWTGAREWTKYPQQTSAPVHLLAGSTYYLEALQKQDGGGDGLAVEWTLPDGRIEAPILGGRLSPYVVGTNLAPHAAFATSSAGLAATLDAAAAHDDDGALVAYRWDFGDGTSGIGASAAHAYAAAGTYVVRLTVADDAGASDSATRSVSVSAGGATTGGGTATGGATTGGATTAGGTATVGGSGTGGATGTATAAGGGGSGGGHGGCGGGAAIAVGALTVALLRRGER